MGRLPLGGAFLSGVHLVLFLPDSQQYHAAIRKRLALFEFKDYLGWKEASAGTSGI